MAERCDRLLADCLTAQRARVSRAEASHAAAIRAESTATDAARAAGDALTAAEADWRRQMAEGFDPLVGGLLAREVQGRAVSLDAAEADRIEAEASRERSADGWRREDARRGALEEEAAIALRRMRHRADERLLATLADRETLRWIRP